MLRGIERIASYTYPTIWRRVESDSSQRWPNRILYISENIIFLIILNRYAFFQ